MNPDELKHKLINAIEQLFSHDKYLLENDINERTIAHRLALYLDPLFPGLDVDCEYNGNVDADNKRKYINVLQYRANEPGIPRERNNNDDDSTRRVYPDIIIHKRGINSRNLLIIEIKKSTNKDLGDYDHFKLSTYTGKDNENTFPYPYGLFMYLNIGPTPGYHLEWYRDGVVMDL